MADFTGPLTNLPITGQVIARTNLDLGAVITMTAQGAGTQTSADLKNPCGRGIMVNINIASKTGTIAVVVNVKRKDPASGTLTTLLSSSSLTATGMVTLKITPDIAAAANLTAQDFIGETFVIEAVHGVGTTPSTTGTISVCIIP